MSCVDLLQVSCVLEADQMLQYMLRRLIILIPVLIGVSILVFAMRVVMPGDPVRIMLFGQAATEEAVERLQRYLGLDKPLHTQYFLYMRNLFRGDLGQSIRSRRPVTTEIFERYPNTLKLTFSSLIIAVIIGVSTGVISAIHKDSWMDLSSMLASLIGVSMPHFWLGLLLMWLFAVHLGWFPVMGSDSVRHLVLPALTLGLPTSAILARLVRSGMLDVLQLEYVRTARAKGLSERSVVYKHALRNALIPTVTLVGLQFGYLLGGAFVIEIVFSFQGIGESYLSAVMGRDFPLIQGIILVYAVSVAVINLAVDCMYSLLNPQIRFG